MTADRGPAASLSGETSLSLVLNWLLRALMAMGGAALVVMAWPVAWGAWEAQKADAVVADLRFGRPLDAAAVASGITALNASIAADPVARHYLDRSELLAGAALTKGLNLPDTDRDALLRRAQSDLRRGLADAPVRGIDWLRLAITRETLEGPSRNVLPPLFMSIESERLPRFDEMNNAENSPALSTVPPLRRTVSPAIGSILSTSAPWSARNMVAKGPETTAVKSSTRTPASGPGMKISL